MYQKLNRKPDKLTHYQRYVPLKETQEAQSIDLRSLMPPIVDQLKMGSCTGNAIAGALGFLELQELRAKSGDVVWDGTYEPVSRLFIYWNERAIEGTTGQDAGASISDGINSIGNKGVCRESTWPYVQGMDLVCPSMDSYAEAWHHKVLRGLRIDPDVDSMKACLIEGNPFVFGIDVYESFMLTGPDGIVSVPDGDFLGGHALCCVGFTDDGYFIVRNSWGTNWGDNGYCYIPIDYVNDSGSDFWTLRR